MATISTRTIGQSEQKRKDVEAKKEELKESFIYLPLEQLYRALILGICGALFVYPIVSAVMLALHW